MDKIIINKKLSTIKNSNNIEQVRIELFGVITSILLSKELFKYNKEMVEFLQDIDIVCKPYIMKSRTAILGKVIRKIEKIEMQEMKEIGEVINRMVNEFSDSLNENIEKPEKVKKNYMAEIMRKYSRTESKR